MKTAAIYLLTAGAALAHPGHPEAEAGVIHWLTSVDHLLVVAALGYAFGLALPALRARLGRKSE
ncbi:MULTISPECIES: HupE/UreJ family protein [unclassified Dinoroseobacter]|uniref:HupE/UreJ family protein n=1 Tax=unclassified Dinoroseobacter TaxID=2620028 RepID=UPI003C7A553F